MVTGLHRDDKMSLNNSMYNSLSFKKKNARIDWRKIAAVDLDRVAKELDVYILQENIDHITFCNIEAEIDTRTMDPNYIKLFKISQYTIEYLMHSQNYLTDVISNVEVQLNTSLAENEEYKKINEKIQKELTEIKKENKKRKKMIETQQTLMSVTSANYHQCAYCSKVFLNVSYLQAHMSRRHSDETPNVKQTSEFEKELERIKERLRITESELMMERSSRLGLVNAQITNNPMAPDSSALLKHLEESKNNEIKQQKEEFKKIKEALKKEIHELHEKNSKFESSIKDLQEKLSKQSHVGWIKDDVDLEKDNALKLKQEIDKQKEIIANYEKKVKSLEDQKSKWKTKENSLKQKHAKEISEKDEEIAKLKTKLAELQNSIGKSDNELRARIAELQELLQNEQELRLRVENDLKNRPPQVTPRNSTSNMNVPPSPPQPVQPTPPTQPSQSIKSPIQHHKADIYLPDYCPLTEKEVETNPNHLAKYKNLAIELFEKELDEFGIDVNDKGLSAADYKVKLNAIKNFRSERTDDLTKFNELRNVFSELSSKHAQNKLNSSLRSSFGNRVTFKNEITSKKLDDYYDHDDFNDSTSHSKVQNAKGGNVHHVHGGHHHHHHSQSEETDDDVSLSNALESDEDDTEPTKSILNDANQTNNKVVWRNNSSSPRKSPKVSGNLNPDEISDLESVSQLLSDRSANRKKNSKNIINKPNNANTKASASVSELAKNIEKQMNQRKGLKPTPNAVPVMFQESNLRRNSREKEHDDDENSFESVSELEADTKNQRPKSGVRSSLQDSNSSSVWVSDSTDVNQNNQQNERPATANSSKTLNFDSDDIENVE